MKHSHHHHENDSSKNLKVAFFLNFSFTIIELIGGIYTNSVAIIADSLHDLGDTLSLGLSWFLEKYSSKDRSKKFSYGYKRFSLLSALINSAILIIGSIVILYKTIPRLLNPETSNYVGMLLLGVLGMIVNGVAVFKLKKGSSLNEKVVAWHLLEDLLGWIAIFIISIINQFIEIPILDPILAVIFAIVIFYNAIKNLKPIVAIFLQSTPLDVDVNELETKIKNIKTINSIHDMHLWTMDSENHILTIHVVLKGKITPTKVKSVKKQIRKVVYSMKIKHVTIEVEEKNEICEYNDC